MSNLINLTLRLGLLTPLHPAAQTPPPPPPPVVVVAPAAVAASPVTSTPSIVAPAAAPPAVPNPAAPVTSTTLSCVVTLTGPDGHPVTFSPVPADSSGSCASAAQGWPSQDTVSVSAVPTTVTAG